MMKSGKPMLVVDSVEKSVKFYTEKLGFDVVDLHVERAESQFLSYAEIKKGKCFIILRTPSIEELAEFSMIKRLNLRGSGIVCEMKKGIDKYFQRCKKKGVSILSELKDNEWGVRSFIIRDLVGFKIIFEEHIEGFKPLKKQTFCGFTVPLDAKGKPSNAVATIEDMIRWIRGFGLLRRVGKKYSKLWLKLYRKEK
ncbi:hypothetical protein COB28_04325 [Candidatus Dependentiae bacterium]|nr:MAG: hypothetical protein COB28_04325 [Candidatus Dependentiae bacterium]